MRWINFDVLQIQELADEAGPLIDALPKALKDSVRYDKVPYDLREDIAWLAKAIEPYISKIKKTVEKLPEQAEKVLDQAEEYVDKASEVPTVFLLSLKI